MGLEVIVELTLLVASITLAVLAITGYDRYLAFKVKTKLLRDYAHNLRSRSILEDVENSVIKKVKATRIGSYLVITIVVRDRLSDSDDEVELGDTTLLTPLLIGEKENSNVPAATS